MYTFNERLCLPRRAGGRSMIALPSVLAFVFVAALMWLSPGTAMAADSVVLVSTGWDPHPGYVGEPMSIYGIGLDTALPTPNSEDTSTPHWSWSVGTVYYSPDGSPGSFQPTGDGDITINPVTDETQPDFNLTATFSQAGFYIVQVLATVTYIDDATGAAVGTDTGEGYVGGDPDFSSNSSPVGTGPGASPALSGPGVSPDTVSSGGAAEDEAKAQKRGHGHGIHVKPLIIIKCNGTPITNNSTPFRVIRGKKVTFTAVAAPGLVIVSGSWTFTSLGAPVKSFGWNKPYRGMIATIKTTPLSSGDLNSPNISLYFTNPAQLLGIEYSAVTLNLQTMVTKTVPAVGYVAA